MELLTLCPLFSLARGNLIVRLGSKYNLYLRFDILKIKKNIDIIINRHIHE